jgi:hypothetical protein
MTKQDLVISGFVSIGWAFVAACMIKKVMSLESDVIRRVVVPVGRLVRFKAISCSRIATSVAFLLLVHCARGSSDLFEPFSREFLDSLGCTSQTIERIEGGAMTQAEAAQLQSELEEKGQVVWQGLWHDEFGEHLGGEGGHPFDLGNCDLNIERADEGFSAEALHVVDQLSLVAISCERKIVTLLKAKEEDASPTPTIGYKIIYSIVNLLKEERHVQWPALEEWAQLSTSQNPIYRLIALEAAFCAVPQQLGLRNRWKMAEPDLNTERVLDQADLVHFSRFLNDANSHLRTKAAKEILARVNTVAIPVEVQQRVQAIVSDAR